MLTSEYLNSKFSYCPITGKLKRKNSNKSKVGVKKQRGNKGNPRYVITLKINNKYYFAHRII